MYESLHILIFSIKIKLRVILYLDKTKIILTFDAFYLFGNSIIRNRKCYTLKERFIFGMTYQYHTESDVLVEELSELFTFSNTNYRKHIAIVKKK